MIHSAISQETLVRTPGIPNQYLRELLHRSPNYFNPGFKIQICYFPNKENYWFLNDVYPASYDFFSSVNLRLSPTVDVRHLE